MNNLIWETMKKGIKFPILLDTNNINNINENNSTYNENTIKINYHTYSGPKVFYNRNKNKINYNNTKNNNSRKTASFSKDFSFNNIRIENQNNLCFLSLQSKPKIKQKNKSVSPKKNKLNNQIESKMNLSIKNYKKNEALLKIKMKKLITPEEIHFMRMNQRLRYAMDINKYNKYKEEKFKTKWKEYFKKNISNRINFFYGKGENEKKN